MTQNDILQLVQQKNTHVFIKAVEKELFLQLVYSLKHGELETTEAKKTAQAFLAAKEKQTIEEFLQEMFVLTFSSLQAREVFVKFGAVFYEQKRAQTLFQVRVHIQHNELDLAVQVAKGGTN